MAQRQTRRRSDPVEELRPEKGRVPPHDLDAEASVLSAMLLEDAAIDEVLDVLGDCVDQHGARSGHPKFYSPANARIMGAICDIRSRGEKVDITTVASWLRSREWIAQIGGPSYLAQIIDATPAIAHVADHARIVLEKWRLRSAIAVCQWTAAHGYGETNVQELLDHHTTQMHEIATASAGPPMQMIGTSVNEQLQRDWNRVQSGAGMMGVRTGIDAFDNKITGLHDGDLYVVAGRPGMGKTSWALQTAINIATPRPKTEKLFEDPVEYGVPIFSLEMPREQLQTRLVCVDGWVDLRRYRAGQLERPEWERVFRAGATLSSLPLWIDDTAGINVPQIRAKLRQLQTSWCRPASRTTEGHIVPARRLGAVIIDYLQLVGSHGEGEKREEVVSSISRALKNMAKSLKLPVIALSQLNRSVETRGKDKRPQLSDLRESGAIEQDADMIAFLYRDEYYNPGNASAKNIAEIIIAKQRNGPTGKVLARFDDYCTRFGNLSVADAQAYQSDSDDE